MRRAPRAQNRACGECFGSRQCRPGTKPEPLEVFRSEAAKTLVEDPEFATLPLETRVLVLRKLDPAFNSLSRYERFLLLFKMAEQRGATQGGLTIGGVPLELAAPDRIKEAFDRMRAKLPDLDLYLDEAARIGRGFGGTRQSVPLEDYVEAMYLAAKHSSFSRLTAAAVPPTAIM